MNSSITKDNKSFLKYIVNIRRSKFTYIIILLAIIPKVIWITKDIIPDSSFLEINIKLAINDSINNLGFIKSTLLKALSFSWMFLLISFFELIKSKKIRNLSLARINFSQGGKYADLIYFLLAFFESKLRFITYFATLGIARFSDNFQTFLNKIYENLVPIDFFANSFTILILSILGLLIFDLGTYISHRISHAFFWEVHEFHHSATEMNILNIRRVSSLERTINGIVDLPFALLGVLFVNQAIEQGQWPVFILWTIFGVAGECAGYIGHSSLKLVFPKPISYIFLSPSLHWLHHSDNPKHSNKNFGRIFSIWDRVFGTYLDECSLKDIKRFGFKHSAYNKNNPFYCYYILPLKKLMRRKLKINF